MGEDGDEPLYCTVCGQEWGDQPDCGHGIAGDGQGLYCHICGCIPRVGGACAYHERGGNHTGCEPEPDEETRQKLHDYSLRLFA